MDYESMTTPQLQAECKRRGLPSGRVKDQLIERLAAADADEASADGDFTEAEMTVEPEPETVVREVVTQKAAPEVTPPEPRPLPVVAKPASSLPATVFQQSFPVSPEGPSDMQHAEYRAATRQAAIDAGRVPRGDAHRIGTVNGREVYEVSVRAVT